MDAYRAVLCDFAQGDASLGISANSRLHSCVRCLAPHGPSIYPQALWVYSIILSQRVSVEQGSMSRTSVIGYLLLFRRRRSESPKLVAKKSAATETEHGLS